MKTLARRPPPSVLDGFDFPAVGRDKFGKRGGMFRLCGPYPCNPAAVSHEYACGYSEPAENDEYHNKRRTIMLMKIATHVAALGVGALAGIYWGVHNPTAAQSIADREQQQTARIRAAIAQGKQQALQQVVNDQSTAPAGSPTAADHVRQMLQAAQQEFNAANAKISN